MASKSAAAALAALSSTQSDPLEAAIAAAAELAKNGGPFLLNPLTMQAMTMPAAAAAAASHSTAARSSPAVSTTTFNAPLALPPSSIAAIIAAAKAATAAGTVTARASPSSLGQQEDDREEEQDDDQGQNLSEEDAERRIARSRERNREHARRTRLRKKEMLQNLQTKVQRLQGESKVLKQSLEECSIASILVGLSTGDERESQIQALVAEASQIQNNEILKVVAGKRKRFLSDADVAEGADPRTSSQPLEIEINGKLTKIGGGRTHINWKSGLYKDENAMEHQLTNEQLESLRRERNRMHAKMTRDRKKNFVSTIQKTIQQLESSNQRMRAVLADVVDSHFKANTPSAVPAGVTPTVSPALLPKIATVKIPALVTPPLASAPKSPTTSQPAAAPVVEEPSSTSLARASKRVAHGFSSSAL
ncbi:MAG: hypothetical protein SGILL_004157 [Bacillariaceae sp.]